MLASGSLSEDETGDDPVRQECVRGSVTADVSVCSSLTSFGFSLTECVTELQFTLMCYCQDIACERGKRSAIAASADERGCSSWSSRVD